MDVFKIWFHLYKVNQLVLLTLISVVIVSLPLAKAQSQNIEDKPEMKFQRIYEGLRNNRVSTIYQDKLGFIWIGTYSGLHKFDGLSFQVYVSSTDSSSINNNYIGSILEDSHNQLWIGTGEGVALYNRESDDFTRFEIPSDIAIQAGESNLVNTIIEDDNGTIWVSSIASGLFFFDPDKKQFQTYKGGQIGAINSMVSGGDDVLWLATLRNGLIKVNTSSDQMEFYQHDPTNPNSISSNNLKTVAIDQEGNLWVGARSNGLNRMALEQGKVSFVRYLHEPGNPLSLYNNSIFKLYVDPNGILWSCNENGGLHMYNKEKDNFFRYLHDPANPGSLTHNSIWNIFQDNQDRYWVGTAQSGINLADPYTSKFDHYFKNSLNAESLNNNIIRDFLETKNGNIWIATDGGGLNYYNRAKGNFKTYTNNPQNSKSLSSDAVISLNEDEEGRLWVGTWAGGVNILLNEEKGVFTNFKDWIKNDTYPIQHVFDVSFDENYIWIAAFDEGLYRYTKKTAELRLFNYNENDPDGISSNQLLRIFEDSNKNLWIGSQSGLSVIQSKDKEEGKFKVYQPSDLDPNSIPSNSIRQIFEDSNQNIWLATERGLARYISEADNFETINQKNGLPVNEITSIVEDDDAYLWIGTIQGIVKFDPDNMVFTGFDKYDGLQEGEFSRYAVLKTRKGELLFGGLNGFNLFHPDHLKSNPYVPPVYLTDFRLFNQSVDFKSSDSPLQKHITEADSIILSYKENIFTFEFIALNYTHPDRNQYAYILEGFEKDWNYVGSQRNATYTNLNPGTYTFRVKAANNDGVWNEDGASIVLVITPPFWKTTWFIFFCILFVVGLLVFTYKWRVGAIKTQNRQLENTVKERTTMLDHANMELKNHIKEKDKLLSIIAHDLRNPFISIIGYMELLEEEFEDSQNSEHLENIQYLLNVSRNTHDLLENLLNWAIKETKLFEVKREVIKMSEMIENASAMVSSQADYKKVILEKSCPEDLFIYADQNMILTVMRNLISNAIKFSNQNSRIEIIVQEKSGEVITSVRDHGTGMDETVLNRLFLKSNIQKSGTLGEMGVGLGLVLCEEIVQKHQGEIWVESSPGKGSTFYFSISRYVFSEEAITH